MRITTWNVNGLRALLRKKAWEWVQSELPDIVCLQETKLQPEQLTSPQLSLLGSDYSITWNSAERRGYSGVATLSREKFSHLDLSLGEEKFDIEGRIIQSRLSDVILFNVYFPSGQSGQERVDYKLEFYAKLLETCDELHENGEMLVVCGDFNTAHQEIDLKNHKQNQKTSGFLPEERAWVQKYLDRGFVDAFRSLYPEKEQYTWWSYRSNARSRNVGWRLDYFLVSEKLLPRVKDVVIHDQVQGSDHCPVSLFLD
ncbi:MAG: exodeoxyribonuclease III [Anaerolineales bacterium]|jgi:exodeoxyribonuclease-3